MSNPTDFLFGGGGKAAKFEEVGDMVAGEILNVDVTQQTDMDTGTPLTWSDGRPREQLVIALQTELHEDDEDDGVRRIYAKGGNYEVASGKGKAMKDAIADALRKVGAKSIDEGGFLRVAYTGVGKKTNRGYSAPKLYTASYEAAKASVAVGDLFED